jgi:hypothetical protein
MAHFAEIDENNVVLRVVVVADENTADESGNEVESIGVAFLKGLFGEETNWLQTSYNHNIRGRYAGEGYTYNADRDVFVPPQPYPSWVYDYDATQWDAPVECPGLIVEYEWNEETTSWDYIGPTGEPE